MPDRHQSITERAASEQVVLAMPLPPDLARRVVEDARRRRVCPADVVCNALEAHFERMGSARGGPTIA